MRKLKNRTNISLSIGFLFLSIAVLGLTFQRNDLQKEIRIKTEQYEQVKAHNKSLTTENENLKEVNQKMQDKVNITEGKLKELVKAQQELAEKYKALEDKVTKIK